MAWLYLDDREERVGREGRRFVRVCVDDGRGITCVADQRYDHQYAYGGHRSSNFQHMHTGRERRELVVPS